MLFRSLALWLGIMKIGEQGGVINSFARLAAPLFGKLFPEIPKNHPVIGRMFMNFSANLLGLDNAATPIGLNVMKELQELNPQKETASNAMIMFIAINASGLTLIPITIMMYRSQLGAAAPADVFIPILLATLGSTITAITLVSIKQRINLLNRAILIPFAFILAFIGLMILLFMTTDRDIIAHHTTTFANILLFVTRWRN